MSVLQQVVKYESIQCIAMLRVKTMYSIWFDIMQMAKMIHISVGKRH